MSSSNFIPTGMWIALERVIDYEGRGYVVTDPQPELKDAQKKLRVGTVHMTKKVS